MTPKDKETLLQYKEKDNSTPFQELKNISLLYTKERLCEHWHGQIYKFHDMGRTYKILSTTSCRADKCIFSHQLLGLLTEQYVGETSDLVHLLVFHTSSYIY